MRRDKDEQEVMGYFGPQVGKLMWRHAALEEDFSTNCLENGVKMLKIDDEDTTEEQRNTIIEVQKTTAKILRIFMTDDEMFKKLEAWKVNSAEMTAYTETIGKLEQLMKYKLCTPKEEVDLIKKNQKILQDKVTKLKEQYEGKKTDYETYVEDCTKSKAQRDEQIKNLKDQINNVQIQNEQLQKEALERGHAEEQEMMRAHEAEMAKLTKDKNTQQKKMDELEKANASLEKEDRKGFVKTFQDYINNMNTYDSEMFGTVAENQKFTNEYEDTLHELKEIEAEYNQRLIERKKRDEINEIMERKKQQQNEKIEKLSRACEWIQAHWRGMLARKEMEKARKGKKKKKKKK